MASPGPREPLDDPLDDPSRDGAAPISPPSSTDPSRTPVKLVGFRDYRDAQAAVDRLSDLGFPVDTVSIVWRGLRRIEQVTGRRTVATAAVEGALSGAWFGTVIGVLFGLITDLPDGSSVFSVALTYLVVGALAGAVWSGIGHGLRWGTRDFSMVPLIDAEMYELWVDADQAGRATELLDLWTHRAQDPDGAVAGGSEPVSPARSGPAVP